MLGLAEVRNTILSWVVGETNDAPIGDNVC